MAHHLDRPRAALGVRRHADTPEVVYCVISESAAAVCSHRTSDSGHSRCPASERPRTAPEAPPAGPRARRRRALMYGRSSHIGGSGSGRSLQRRPGEKQQNRLGEGSVRRAGQARRQIRAVASSARDVRGWRVPSGSISSQCLTASSTLLGPSKSSASSKARRDG